MKKLINEIKEELRIESKKGEKLLEKIANIYNVPEVKKTYLGGGETGRKALKANLATDFIEKSTILDRALVMATEIKKVEEIVKLMEEDENIAEVSVGYMYIPTEEEEVKIKSYDELVKNIKEGNPKEDKEEQLDVDYSNPIEIDGKVVYKVKNRENMYIDAEGNIIRKTEKE